MSSLALSWAKAHQFLLQVKMFQNKAHCSKRSLMKQRNKPQALKLIQKKILNTQSA